jgi:hypothetical protein
MPNMPGQIISIGSLLVANLGNVTGTVEEASDPATLEPDFAARYGSAAEYVGSAMPATALTLQFASVTTYAQKTALLRALRYPNTETPLTLAAYMGDPADPTPCAVEIAVKTIDPQPGTITVVVEVGTGVWTAIAETTVGPYRFADIGAMALSSAGQATTYPTVTIKPVTQRATDDATVSWRYRRRITVTNNTDKDWIDRPHCVDLGDTAAWVTAGKAQSDGADIRVRRAGYDFARTLVNFNTKRTFLWWLVTLKAGASATYDVLYGNPVATAYLDLSTRSGTRDTYVAFDLEGINGTATSGTSSSLTNGALAMETNRWRDGFIQIVGGTGAGQMRRISSNTGVTFNVARNWSTSPDNTSVYVVWRSGVAAVGGIVTAKTASTMTDSSQAWNANEWVGATVSFLSPSTGTKATIVSNDATSITIAGTFGTQPAVGASYVIQRYGQHTYNVDPTVYNAAHLGLWRQNQWYSKPSQIWIHNDPTPGGWAPTLYLDNDDDFAQSRTFNLGSGGGHAQNWRGIGRARRRLHQDGTYPDEGQADGIAIYAPEGYQGIWWDYKLKNENGVGEYVFSVLEPGGESWRNVVTNSARYASLTAGTQAAQWRDLSNDNNPIRLYMGVLPVNETSMAGLITEDGEVTAHTATTITDSNASWEVNEWSGARLNFGNLSTSDPKTMTVTSNTATVLTVPSLTTQPTTGDPYHLERNVAETDEVEFRTGSRLYLVLDLDGIGGLTDGYYQIGAETEIYNLNAVLRLGGGTNAEPPYDLVRIGGKNGHWLALDLTAGESLKIASDPDSGLPLAGIYSSSGTLVEACPWAARFYHTETDADGSATDIVSRAFLPIAPGDNLLPNPGFETDLSGWTAGSTTAGVTATWSRDTGTTADGSAGALKCVITATPAGSWSTSYTLDAGIDVVAGAVIEAAALTRTDTVPGLNARLTLALTSFPTVVGGNFDFPFPDDNTWYPLGIGYEAPDDLGTGIAAAGLTLTVYGSGSGKSGTVYFDTVSLGVPNLWVSETAIGELDVTVSYNDRYVS